MRRYIVAIASGASRVARKLPRRETHYGSVDFGGKTAAHTTDSSYVARSDHEWYWAVALIVGFALALMFVIVRTGSADGIGYALVVMICVALWRWYKRTVKPKLDAARRLARKIFR